MPLRHISAQTVRGALGLPDGLEALQSGGASGTSFSGSGVEGGSFVVGM